MNRTINASLVTALFIASVASSLASPMASCPMPSSASAKTSKTAKLVQVASAPKDVKCSVTGEDIGAPSQAFNSSVYKGHTYYFCCGSCKPMFDADPAKYAKPEYAYPLAATAKPAAATAAK
jgi:YHS domain-containing protein